MSTTPKLFCYRFYNYPLSETVSAVLADIFNRDITYGDYTNDIDRAR